MVETHQGARLHQREWWLGAFTPRSQGLRLIPQAPGTTGTGQRGCLIQIPGTGQGALGTKHLRRRVQGGLSPGGVRKTESRGGDLFAWILSSPKLVSTRLTSDSSDLVLSTLREGKHYSVGKDISTGPKTVTEVLYLGSIPSESKPSGKKLT